MALHAERHIIAAVIDIIYYYFFRHYASPMLFIAVFSLPLTLFLISLMLPLLCFRHA